MTKRGIIGIAMGAVVVGVGLWYGPAFIPDHPARNGRYHLVVGQVAYPSRADGAMPGSGAYSNPVLFRIDTQTGKVEMRTVPEKIPSEWATLAEGG